MLPDGMYVVLVLSVSLRYSPGCGVSRVGRALGAFYKGKITHTHWDPCRHRPVDGFKKVRCITCVDPKVRSVNRDQPSGVSDTVRLKNEYRIVGL